MSRDLFDLMGEGSGPRHVNGDDTVESVKLHDLTMAMHYDTGKAILVSETGEESKAVWLPHSQIEFAKLGKDTGAVKKDGQRVRVPLVTVTIKEWMAKEKGLI